jgi:hypothetical protein
VAITPGTNKGNENGNGDEDPNIIEPVCGYFSKDDHSKMAFLFEKVEPDEQVIPYQASSFFKALFSFYSFLNHWAIDDVDEEDLDIQGYNGLSPDLIDKKKYDFQMARQTDTALLEAVE